jgi:hypothetical protein
MKGLINIESLFKGIFLALLIALAYGNNRLKKQNERLGQDVSGLSVALQAHVDTTRNSLGQMRASTSAVVLSQAQANEIIKAETRKIKDQFDVRINGLKSYIQVSSKYTIPVVVQGKDTIIYNNTETVYYTPNGTLYTKGDTLVGSIVISDTVRIVVSKGKREKWWEVWKRRPLVTNAFMSSPSGSITELKSVLVQE